MKVYYIANFYMPFGKAYGIQLAKMCEAFIEEGVNLTLVVPKRGPCGSLKEFYGLRVEVPTIWLPAFDLKSYDKLGYAIMALAFSISYTIFFWYKWLRGERFVLYTIDADQYASSALAFAPGKLFTEMHGGKNRSLLQKLLFSKLSGVIAINRIIIDELKHTFPRSHARYIAEPNGVDIKMFSARDQKAARERLNLPLEGPMVLYAGRFYCWKGLEVIPRAAVLAPEIRWQLVGGTREEFAALVKEEVSANMYFAGARDYAEMPLWIAAADAVLVLGTKRDEQSYRWTSPMKLFEYLLSDHAIVASDTPAIREIVSSEEVFFYQSDDPESLAEQVETAIHEPSSKIAAAKKKGETFSWKNRAQRIIRFMERKVSPLV